MSDNMIEEIAELLSQQLHVDKGQVAELLREYQDGPRPRLVGDGWSVEDVRTTAEEMGYEFDQNQLDEILSLVEDGFDASVGINWTVIETHISMYAFDHGIERTILDIELT